MRLKIFIALLMMSTVQTHAAGFDIVREDTLICKISDDRAQAKICIPQLAGQVLSSSASFSAVMPSEIEIVSELRAYNIMEFNIRRAADVNVRLESTFGNMFEASSGFTLSPENRARVLNEFNVLRVKNAAVDMANAKSVEGGTEVPFFASVYWENKAGLNGTVQVEGFMTLPSSSDSENEERQEVELNEALATLFDVRAFSDSSTEQRIAALRFLETSARTAHFKTVVGMNADVDAETVRLLETVVGPAVFGKLFVPMIASVAESLVQALGQALGEAL